MATNRDAESKSALPGYRVHGNDSVPICHGCQSPIVDPRVVKCLERTWHRSCLTCNVCSRDLDQLCHVTRSGHLLCTKDHMRLNHMTCAGCDVMVEETERVHRIHSNIYHTNCFRCVDCERPLVVGQKLYLRFDGQLLCCPCHDGRF